MEGVEGMMKNMKLSEVERKGIRVGEKDVRRGGGGAPQAIAKLFSEKPARAADVEQALENIWCPSRGLSCKDLGDNHFLFTFHQASGKRRAMEDGPWMFRRDLLVVIDFDPMKTLEEMEFHHVPVWVRVSKLPVGMMNKSTAELIGEQAELGTLDVDVDEDGVATGAYLRMKVKIDVRKPILRGVTLEVGREDKRIWCPFVYEYLPDFCHVCGILGHTDRDCDSEERSTGVKQYGQDLRVFPGRGRSGEDGSNRNSGGSGSFWSGRSSGGSWRKEEGAGNWRKERASKGKNEEKEVTSPPKLTGAEKEKIKGKKLVFGHGDISKSGDVDGNDKSKTSKEKEAKTRDKNQQGEGEGSKRRGYKKRERKASASSNNAHLEVQVGQKHGRDYGDVIMGETEEEVAKKMRVAEESAGVSMEEQNQAVSAGLPEQPCRDQ